MDCLVAYWFLIVVIVLEAACSFKFKFLFPPLNSLIFYISETAIQSLQFRVMTGPVKTVTQK